MLTASVVAIVMMAVGVLMAVRMATGVMVVGAIVVVVIEVVTVMQDGQEHWPNRQRDGPNSGFWILVKEIRGLSKSYNAMLIGHLSGGWSRRMIDMRWQGRDFSLLVQPKSRLHQNL